uniref:GG12314 n=1 Tax=Drosophila erecta TaxID=7220 RepID=B3P6X7_DROER
MSVDRHLSDFENCTLKEMYSHIEFTSFKCASMDKDVVDFEYCSLKSVNRTYQHISAKVNFGLHQQIQGYKPFLYNVSLDGCQFIKNTRSNAVARYFYDFIKDTSNLNHSCPYDHDLILDKLSSEAINSRLPKVLPFPTGNYMFQTYWMVNEKYRAVTKIYFAFYNGKVLLETRGNI